MIININVIRDIFFNKLIVFTFVNAPSYSRQPSFPTLPMA